MWIVHEHLFDYIAHNVEKVHMQEMDLNSNTSVGLDSNLDLVVDLDLDLNAKII